MMFSHNSSIFAVTLFFLPLHYINAMYTSQDYGKLGPMNIAEINKSQNLDLELSLQPSWGKETETMHAIQGEIDTADARNVPNPIQSGITVTNVGKKRKIKLFCKECDVIPDMPFVVFEPLERYHPWAGVGSDKKIKGLSLVVSITTSQTPPIRFKLPIFGRHWLDDECNMIPTRTMCMLSSRGIQDLAESLHGPQIPNLNLDKIDWNSVTILVMMNLVKRMWKLVLAKKWTYTPQEESYHYEPLVHIPQMYPLLSRNSPLNHTKDTVQVCHISEPTALRVNSRLVKDLGSMPLKIIVEIPFSGTLCT